MMEKVDRVGQEEFIWAMRSRNLMPMEEDSDSWKDRSFSSSSYDYSQLDNMSRQMDSIPETDLKALASLVPDEIIYDSTSYTPRTYQACVLYGHITGFDELCEKFSQGMKGGPSQLTTVLNTYLGTIIQEIMLYGGDVIKFSADSFLAIWKTGLYNQSMQDCVHQALDCAMVIKKNHESYETQLGVIVTVKLAIAAGAVVFSMIGSEELSQYICIGPPVCDSKEAWKLATGGTVVVTTSAWDYINPNEYFFDSRENWEYIEVRGFSTNWRSIQRNFTKDDVSLQGSNYGSKISFEGADDLKDIFELRGCMSSALKVNLLEDLRKFILPPLMAVIEVGDRIEYLTEMRQVVVLVLNIRMTICELLMQVKTIDECYKTICREVDPMGGRVNQVALSGGDVRFLVIFGFRGYKHELECQRGLKCGMQCYKNLIQMPNIVHAGVSVTTGLMYCGAIGHNFRREYTVIGPPLYKALKLISVSTNHVTCDRDTFLQSKLEAKYFILQDHQPLKKDLLSMGPIYEYVETKQPPLSRYPIIYYPILDREIEINLYMDLLHQRKNDSSELDLISSLVVFGKAMEGKTRLTEEILYCTPPDIPIFRIQLISSDKNVPYQAVYFVFSIPLGIQEKTTFADREAKLISRLRQIKAPQLYCLLNVIFRVNFEKSSIFNSLTENQKNFILKKMITQLSYACFTKFWVIVIDGGEFIDDESWPLIGTIMETFKVLLVITVSSSEELCAIAQQVIRSHYVKVINLKPIDKWFHVGLACQFLEVYGIPPELEMILQNKSNGNPGWIQSFLVTLLQEHKIEIDSIPTKLINDYGLVLPTPHMISRHCEEHRTTFDCFSGTIASSNIFTFLENKWEIYRYSYKDSATKIVNLPVKTVGSHKGLSDASYKSDTFLDKHVDVCFIKSTTNLLDISSEGTFDVIMKIFDYLTSYEQLLLKCSSVIGETFSRDMLTYLLNSDSEHATVTAVKRLFEIGVLGCAQGKFINGSSNSALNAPKINNINHAIQCRCEGLTISDAAQDYPKYASCGFMYFKISSFKESTYGMLTMFQRKEYHTRAIRYLEKKVRRCAKCGGGFFSNVFGVRYDEEIYKIKRKIKLSVPLKTSSMNVIDYVNRKKSMTGVSASNPIFHLESTCTFKSFGSGSKDMSKGSSGSMPRRAYVNYLRQGSFVRTFSSIDFSSCECNKILYNMYKQIREHCEATDLMDKWMEATLEYSMLCIETYNVPTAIKVLSHALEVVDNKFMATIKPGENWKIPFTKAKLFTLLGKSRLMLGQLKAAYKAFEMALKCFGYRFPNGLSIRLKVMEIQQHLMLHYFVHYGIGTKTGYMADFCDRLSDCLSLMCTLFMNLDLWRNAEIAAIWSLKKALQSLRDFPTLITAFANLIYTYIRNRKLKNLTALEVKALMYCNRFHSIIEMPDLESVVKLYSSIFVSRIVRCDLNDSVNMGCLIIKICNSLNKKFISMDVFPVFIHLLMLQCKVYDGVNILISLQQSTMDELDYYGITWFYALCLCIHLDTGFNILPINQFENYYFAEHYSKVLHRESTAEKRYYTCMWLWYLRTERYEKAEIWEAKIKRIWTIKQNDKIVNTITGLYYLEALILAVIYKMDRKKHEAVEEAFQEINSLLGVLYSHVAYIRLLAPRLYHLKAYYVYVKQGQSDGLAALIKALKMAESTGSTFDENWIKHSSTAWNNELSAIEYNFWRDHAEYNVISYKLLENNDKLGYYTLEPPLYV